MKNLISEVSTLENAARVAALRSLANSAGFRAVGALERLIRQETRMSRNEDETADNLIATVRGTEIHATGDLDTRNAQDEYIRGAEHQQKVADEFGFDLPDYSKKAEALANIFAYCTAELRTLTLSNWDLAMSLDDIIEFRSRPAKLLNGKVDTSELTNIRKISEVTGIEVNELIKAHNDMVSNDRSRFLEVRDEIRFRFDSMVGHMLNIHGKPAEFIDPEQINDLDPVTQHQLGVKTVEGLQQAYKRTVTSLLRPKGMANFGDIEIFKAGIKQLSEWVGLFETTNRSALQEAVENGANLRTL